MVLYEKIYKDVNVFSIEKHILSGMILLIW